MAVSGEFRGAIALSENPLAGGSRLEVETPARPRYRGRFAPSPTGPLHFGSLVAAVGSYLSARSVGGEWLVRIDDLDPPRVAPGSADQIIAALDAFGFEWTESILRQSTRTDAYQAAIANLLARNLAFPCSCSRSELQSAQPASSSDDELRYPGWCRNGVRSPHRSTAIRFRVSEGEINVIDEIQGPQTWRLTMDTGDFIIRRRDQLHAYQLAVVVDDADQRITHVVRGADLLRSTPRQVALQRALGLPTPVYAHLPVATDANGIKLSKSTGAAAINTDKPSDDLWRALRFLKQAPPYELRSATVAELWKWAIEHWRTPPLPGQSYAARIEPPA